MEVHSQTFPYVSFMGQTLVNHSYVNYDLVGRPDQPLNNPHSVECHTDLTTCCSGSDGVHRGDWYFPDGTRLPVPQSTGIFEVRDSQRVDLRRNYQALTPSGIYRCGIAVYNVSDMSVRDLSVYVGLYDINGGTTS